MSNDRRNPVYQAALDADEAFQRELVRGSRDEVQRGGGVLRSVAGAGAAKERGRPGKREEVMDRVKVATSGSTLNLHHVCEHCKTRMLYRVDDAERVFMFCQNFPGCYLALKEHRVLPAQPGGRG